MLTRIFISLTLALNFATFCGAASFDCNEASTKTEHEICNDPTLSLLDEQIAAEYRLLNSGTPLSSYSKKSHITWLRNEREATKRSLTGQLETLRYLNIANTCEKPDWPQYSVCVDGIQQQMFKCMDERNHTTAAMNLCGSSLIKAYGVLLEKFIDEERIELESDFEALEKFSASNAKWAEFIELDCERQYLKYRHGTMRYQIYYGCKLEHYRNRLSTLSGESWRIKR